ncbi:hypothetical protein C772_00707 [Bhargavaea cecembensis DSE10]|uniref:SGNH hydrolase-type esterase domain-containing protein n=1 Tax=Bhargavaea cecembensis DSE10 TaxID=1235279 RepID=M7NII5_9BACL|nr:SGNH/GDSL hydrolase family protein [Bhargavaea cecembensis]EMR07062.1 hypothetical protein C772_00707 [Bhargavaea cecembensis DSE10]
MKQVKFVLLLAAAGALLLLFRPEGKGGKASADVATIESVDPLKNPGQPVADYLVFRALTTGEARMAVTGSSVTKGSGASNQSKTWRALTQAHLRTVYPSLNTLKIENHGHSGYTSVRLLEDEVTGPVIAGRPDVLIIETSVINNHNKNVSLDDTYASLEQLHALYSEVLPEARILFISPNPITENKFGPQVNTLGLQFTDYVYGTQAFIENKGWAYINIHDEMLSLMEQRGVRLPETLKDGIHPNDLGYRIWADVIWPHLTAK